MRGGFTVPRPVLRRSTRHAARRRARPRRLPRPVAATPGLVGHWQFDEPSGAAVADSAGSTDLAIGTGTFSRGLAPLTTDDDGAAARLTTSVALGPDIFDFPGQAPYSAEVWIRPSEASGVRHLVGKWNQIGWALQIDDLNRVRFLRQNISGSSNDRAAQSSVRVQRGVVHHVVGTYDGAALRIYVDGALAGSHTITAPSAQTLLDIDVPFAVGARNDRSRNFAGTIDDGAIYSRELSAVEVTERWTTGSAWPTPSVSVTSGPTGQQTTDQATFAFTTGDPWITFRCRLDGGAWSACTTPHTVTGLDDGAHRFEVEAANAGGVTAVAERLWSSDVTPPQVAFGGTPTKAPSGTIAFTLSESATTTCSLDGDPSRVARLRTRTRGLRGASTPSWSAPSIRSATRRTAR